MKKVVPIFWHNGSYISRIVTREGPSPVFVCLYKGAATIKTTKKGIIKFCQLNKGLPTRTLFDKWWDDYCMDDFPEVNLNMEDIKKTGWGPEAHNEHTELDPSLKQGKETEAKASANPTTDSSLESIEEEDPTKNTKMIM